MLLCHAGRGVADVNTTVLKAGCKNRLSAFVCSRKKSLASLGFVDHEDVAKSWAERIVELANGFVVALVVEGLKTVGFSTAILEIELCRP